MCYWVIYIKSEENNSKLNYAARPFASLEEVQEWLSKTEKIEAIAITQSIYKDV